MRELADADDNTLGRGGNGGGGMELLGVPLGVTEIDLDTIGETGTSLIPLTDEGLAPLDLVSRPSAYGTFNEYA